MSYEKVVTKVAAAYWSSDGEATRRLFAELLERGPRGAIAVNLFRAQKASDRAKAYRGGHYRSLAYDRKAWAMDQLCAILHTHAAREGFFYGWKQDPAVLFDNGPSWVLYVETPVGQVSFHTPRRGEGPDFNGAWDGDKGAGSTRVVRYCEMVYGEPVVAGQQLLFEEGVPTR